MFRRVLNRKSSLESVANHKARVRKLRRGSLNDDARRQLRLEALEQRALLTASPWELANLDIAGPDGVGKDGPLAVVGFELAQMYRLQANGQLEQAQGVAAGSVTADRIIVDVATSGDVAEFKTQLTNLGMELTGSFRNMVSGWLPVDKIDDLAAVPGLRTVQVATASRGVGSVTSQGDPAMVSDGIRSFLGFNGTGQQVGILSDSFNDLGGAAADVASGDLPGPGNPNGFTTAVNVLDDTAAGVDSDEGRGMLQLVHDVAPGAALSFHTAFTGQGAFAQGILDLQAAGATVIADDVFYFHEPFFMDGVIAQAADLVASTGTPYFALANNHGRNSYESAYRPSGTVYADGDFASAAGAPHFFGGESQDFDSGAGVDDRQSFTLANNQSITISFQWDDPFFSHTIAAEADTDLDIYILDSTNTVVAGSADDNVGGDPVEVFGFTNTTGATQTYNLMMLHFAGPAPNIVKYINLTNGAPGMGALEFATNSGTAYGHANANLGMSVGAAFALNTPDFGVSPAVIEGFSSAGGIPTLFDTAGNPIAAVVRQTPDVVGPDGGNTTFFGGDSLADADAFPNFFGTSAATPHVAALAALIRQANPGITVAQVNDTLRNTALDMDDPATGGFDVGFDFRTGFGFVSGPAALAAGPGGAFPVTFGGTAGGDTMLIRRDASGNIEFLLGGVLQFEFPVADITSITVNGLAGNDALTVDFSGGNPIPAGGISYAGGESAGDNDRLTITGYALNTADGVADVTINHMGTESGNVVLSGLGTIAFSEIEPLALAGTAADLVINLPNTANPDVVLSDDGGAADPDATNNAGASAIDGSTFEFTQFTNPTNTLTINGGTNNDAISVQGLDAAYAAGLIIQGGAGGTNSVTFQTAATNLGGGALTVGTLNTVNSIAVNASVTASGATLTSQAGGISFNASGALNVGAGTATLTATGGSITGIATGAAKIIAGTLNLTVTGAGNDIGTSAAAPLEINAVTLNASTAGAAGDDIFIDDMAGGLAAGLITAGAGNVDLDVLGGSLISAAGDAGVADIVGNVVTLDVTGAGSDIGASTTARLEVNANSLNGSTAGAAGDDMFLLETNGLTALNLNAGAGIIDLLVLGPVTDADAGDDLTAADLILDVAGGIGVAGTPINTNVARADIRNTIAGGIFLTDTVGGLILTQLGGANGNAVDGLGGNGEIRANSPLTIAANAITAGGMTYTAADSAAAGDNLTVNSGVTVQDTTAALVMNGGDNITFDTASVVRAFTALTINGDTGGAVDAAGSDISLFGTIRSDVAGIFINGNVQDDTIAIDNNGLAAGGTVAGVVTSAGNGLTVAGQGGNDTLQLQDFSDLTPDTFSIQATTISEGIGDTFFDGMSPGDGLTYAGLEVINIQTSNIAGGANGDTVTVFDLNPGTAYNLDGNDPTTLPGDTLNIAPVGPINVYEVAGNYVFELGGSLNVQEFETINLVPGDGVLNIIGDEGQGTTGGGAGTDEADGVFVAGTGPNSGQLLLTHNGAPIAVPSLVSFFFTATLNIRTFDLDDDVTLDPFADNTIGGWGIQVQVDGGADGANGDDILYGNAAFLAGYDAAPDGSRSGVSERVVLAPTTTTGAGQIRSTNATDGTNILTATFIGMEDVSFFLNDGAAGDTDSLELVTSALGETITVNLTNVGDDTGAWVDLDLTAPATQLLQVERAVRSTANAGANATQSSLAVLGIQAGDGDDVFNVTPRSNAGSPLAPTTINLDAGNPSASDVINVAGTADADDSYANTAGAAPGAGSLVVTLAASPTTIINYTATESIAIQGGGGTGQDTLTLNGTGGPDAFTLTGTGAGAGTTQTNDGPTITFAGFGSTSSDVELNGQGGDDSFSITHVAGWALDQIRVNGGAPAASDRLVIQGATGVGDQLRLAPTGAGAGTITGGAGAATTVFTGVEHLAVVLQNETNDSFTVDGTAGDDHYYITSGLLRGEVHIRGTMNQPGGAFELPQIDVSGNSLSVIGTLNFNGAGGTDRLTLTGTDRNDQFDLIRTTATSGAITHRVNGLLTNFIGFANLSAVTVDGLAGDDTFNVPGNFPFVLNINGGDPSSGSDVLNVTGSGGAVALDLAAQTITETSAISFTGVEAVNLDANAALTVTGTPDNDTFQVTPLNADHDGRFTHDRTPAVAFGYTDATSVTFAGGVGGDDVLSVLGDEAADLVAAGADTVTVDGSTVTVGAGIDELSVSGLGGNDNIVLTGFTTASRVTVRGGEGDDSLVGSPNADVLYGGIGDDVLIGGANNDILYGEEGNDRFGDPAVRDPAANDTGNDLFVGGAGSDLFFWDPGDGDDVVEGGAGDADQILFFGSGGAEQFSLYADVADASRFHLFRSLGSIDVVASDVEEVNLATGGGADVVSVGRDLVSNTLTNLQTTGLRVIDVNLGADGANDTVTVEGHSTDDQMHASLNAGIVTVSGLGFDVRLTGPDAAITDTLILSGNDGDDTIVVGNGVETQFDLVLNGSAGRDTLDTSATLASAATNIALNGGDGNDQLIGGAGNETMDGGAGDDTFAGNGGTDAIGAGIPDVAGDRIFISGTPGADAFVLALDAAGHLLVTINGVTTTYTDFLAGPIATSGIDLLLVEGGLGSDVLTVDSANGAIPIAIEYYGGGGSDGLVLQGGTAVSDDYFPGPNPGQGVSVIDIGGVVQTVTFAEIEPLLDLVAGPLTVNATPADNAINYGPGVGQGNGLVSIDNFETIEFSNKTTLTINALAGKDTINIANPATPNGLTGITVDGGDPGAGDVLVITGTVNAEAFEYAPTGGSNAGSVLVAGLPTVAFDGVSAVTIDGRSTAADDTLTVRSEAGFDMVGLTPSATLDGGTIQIKATAGTESTPPLTFLGLGQDATLTLLSGNAGTREDEFEYFGTSVSDTIGVTNAGQINLNGQIAVLANGANRLVLRGLDGSDVINLAGGHPFAGGVRIDGGSPGAGSDTLNITGAAGVAEAAIIRPDATIPSEQDVVGFGVSTIDVTGVELITVTAQAADGDSLNVELGDGDNFARVERGSDVGTLNADLVTSDSLPAIQFAGESRFRVTAGPGNGAGADVVTFATWFLAGATNANYEFDGGVSDLLIIEGVDSGLNGNDDFTVSNPAGANPLAISDLHGTTPTVTVVNATLGRVQINALGGDDEVIINLAGLDLVTIPITFDGGTNADTLTVTGAPNQGATVATYSPGPAAGQGRLTHVAGGLTMTVDILNLEPVIDLVPGTLTVNGTDLANTIDYRANGANGLISVDEFETIEFNNKTNVTLNGGAGSDQFHVAGTNTGFTGTLFVNGDSPVLDGDTLTVTGVAATLTVDHAAGTLAGALNAAAQLIDYGTVEQIRINAGASQRLAMTGSSSYEVLPGAEADQGEVLSGGVPVSFDGFGGASFLRLTGDGQGFATVHGTASNDLITVERLGGFDTVTTAGRATIETAALPALVVDSHAGDDTFVVNGSAAFTYAQVQLNGGDGDDQDTLFANTPALGVTADLGLAAITGYGPAGMVINYTGLQSVVADAGGAPIDVIATAGDDDVTVTPADANSGSVELGNHALQAGTVLLPTLDPVLFYTNTAGNAVRVDLAGGSDTLIVVGSTPGNRAAGQQQVFDIDMPNARVRIDDENNGVFDGTVTYANNESLAVYGLEGDDDFNVTVYPAAVVGGDQRIPLFVDGGDPIGQTAGDRINLNANGNGVMAETGPENDEGGFQVAANARISFDHIEAATVNNAPCAIIMGTNGDDDITIIARNELANPAQFVGANGQQDFTSSVNAGVEILWLNVPDLYIDALSGDDDMVIRAPAPDGVAAALDWDVHVRIVGGPPSGVTGDQGDVIILETPGNAAFARDVIYTADGSDTGRLLLDEDNSSTYSAASTDSLIEILNQFVVDCDGDGVNEYRSSPGGTEQLVYDAEGTNGNFTVFGNPLDVATNDAFVHTPGTAFDEGTFRNLNLLGIRYQNLAQCATVQVDGRTQLAGGSDILFVDGTQFSDLFAVAATTSAVTLNGQLPLTHANIEQLSLDGLDGDDSFVVNTPFTAGLTDVFVNGQGPGGSDSLTVVSNDAAIEAFAVALGTLPGDGNVQVNAVNTPYTGIEHVLVDGSNANTDNLTVADDSRDNVWTISGGPPVGGQLADRVQITGRESLDYVDFNNVTLNNQSGTDSFVVYPTNLGQFAGAFTVNGDAGAPTDDVLTLVGTPGNDTVTSPAVGPVVSVNGTQITAGANLTEIRVLTLDGNDNINLDLDLPGDDAVRKVIDAGAGNDTVDMLGSVDADIFGGLGDDTIIGSPDADLIFGGPGNDILIGAGGIDTIYGEDGNDIFGNPALTANGVADDAGNDRFFGGAGSDTFIWEPGDGSDTIEGGAEEADVLLFFGSAGAETFNVFAKLSDPSRAILFRSLGNITMDMAGIDQINVSGGAGVDRYVVGRANDGDAGDDVAPTSPYVDPTATLSDLSTTEVRVVNVTGAAADGDFVFVDGRPLDDNLLASVESTATGVVRVAGLPYDVRVIGATPADLLTIRGNEGHDVVKAQAGVEGIIGVTLAGGTGDDQLSADAILIGGPGDDFLEGGAGNDQLFGNQGEDTMIGLGGNDTFDGGADFDTILIPGTSGNDRIDVNQTAAATLVHDVNGVTETDTLALVAGVRTVERALVQAGDGDDIIRVQWADSLGQSAVIDSLRMDVEGGDDFTRDRLAVVDTGTGDLVLYRKGELDSTGSMTVGPAEDEPLEAVFQGIEYAEPVSGTDGRVIVFKHDPFEFNNSRFLATHLGADGAINVDPTIDPGADAAFGLPSDQDFYRFEAKYTGTLDLQVFFEELPTLVSGRAGLPGDGNLDVRVLDADGTVIAGAGAFGDDDPTNQNDVNLDGDAFREDERIRIPAVQGQTYYLQVFGVGAAINTYNMTILNEPAPVPFDIELDDNPADPTYDCNAANPSGLNSDTGRSHFDNITCDNTPTIVFRLDDGVLLNDLPGNNVADTPPDQVIPIPFRAGPAQPVQPGYAIAIFDEGATAPAPGNAPNANIRVPLGFATQIEPGLYQFTTPVLNDGSHFLTARVQMIDPANPQKTGFGERSQSLEIVVDTQDPQSYFGVTAVGDDGLHPNSDSGVDGPASPDTYTDRITNDTTPTFYGLAEADTVVRMYLDINQNNAVDAGDVFLGQTTAVPFDGNNQFGSPTFKPDGSVAIGQWEITSTVHMNDTEARSLGGALVALPFDGLRRVLITAEDVAGNVNAPQVLDIFVDTQGPQVTSVYITADPAFDLFDPKVPGGYLIPTPLINSISIDVQDLPNRIAAFVYDALELVPAITAGHFQLRGDYNGIIPINTIAFLSDPQVVGVPRTGTIVLTFAEPLPDDRFTLTILDDVVDPAGNALDGENNAVEPQETPNFPTGDGQPGYDFVARFTVDSRPEVGVWASGNAWIDTNGNNKFDPDNADFVNRDIVYSFGNGSQVTGDPSITTDDLFAGNFSFPGGPAADGFDKLAAYGAIGFGLNNYRWLIDTDNDGVPDINNAEPLNINGLPVAGNFDGNLVNGDEVAVYTGTEWYFDTDHNYQLNANSRLVSNLQGYPIIGDFDGDGLDDLATWTDDRFMFDLSSVGASAGILPGLINGQADRTINFGFIGVRELPVAADMDKDGIDDIGLWVPERNGQAPEEMSEWYFLISGAGDLRDGYLPGAVVPGITAFNRLSHAFEPVPFGRDLYAQYGDTYGVAIVGNFDPPVTGTGSAGSNPVDFTNDRDPNDINGDGYVTPIDVLVVVNALNERRTSTDATIRSGKLFGVTTAPNYLDPNGDTYVSPADALKVINFMNARGPLGGEGEGAVWTGEVDAGTVLPAASAAAELSVPALVVDRADADLATAAGWLATLDTRAGAVRSADPQDLVALLAQDTATRQTSDGAWQSQEVHSELVSELGASELTADLLEDLSVVTNEEDTDQAIEELFG